MFIDTDIQVIKDNLSKKGFACITLNPSFQSIVNECVKEMSDFFNLPSEEKESYFQEPVFGWFEVPHKQVFRIATCNEINIPSKTLTNLIPGLNDMMKEFASLLFPDFPFQFGLIDVALYNNQMERKLNIVEHYDAGLLGFNFFNQPGLQFKDDDWVDIEGCVIWTSNAVKTYYPNHPVGIHRVVKTDKPRLSMWYEVAIPAQLRDDIKNNQYIGYDYEIELMKKEGFEPVRNKDGYIETFTGNTYVGWKASEAITTGSNKIAIGWNALQSNTSNNVEIGNH